MDAKGLQNYIKGALGSWKHVAWACGAPSPTSLRNGSPNANSGLELGTENFKMMRYTFQSRYIKGIVQRINTKQTPMQT